jgi:hypothetical protein
VAIIKLAAPIAAIRGKLGGLIFSENKAAAYIKPWTLPTFPNSTRQQENKTFLNLVRQNWSTLNQSQIDAWNALAAAPPELDYNPLGDQYFLSGAQWHARINLRRLRAGQLIQNTAPPSISVPSPLTFELDITSTDDPTRSDRFNYSPADFAGHYAVLFCAVTLSNVVQSYSRSYSLILEDTVVGPPSQDITVALEDKLGYLQADTKVFGLLHKQSQAGIRSLPIATTTLVKPAP